MVGAGNFSLYHRVQTSFGAHPASYPMGTRALGVKWLRHEADHSPPSSVEVKECFHSPSTPLWHGAQLKKAQGQVYLTFGT